jgi:hypothetical protein
MELRIYADFNSGGSPGHGPCWLLLYGDPKRRLDEMAHELQLQPGMTVTLFYEDPAEEFEVSAILEEHAEPNARARWQAMPDWRTYRLIRGTL